MCNRNKLFIGPSLVDDNPKGASAKIDVSMFEENNKDDTTGKYDF
jgi:hypothetical protein